MELKVRIELSEEEIKRLRKARRCFPDFRKPLEEIIQDTGKLHKELNLFTYRIETLLHPTLAEVRQRIAVFMELMEKVHQTIPDPKLVSDEMLRPYLNRLKSKIDRLVKRGKNEKEVKNGKEKRNQSRSKGDFGNKRNAESG